VLGYKQSDILSRMTKKTDKDVATMIANYVGYRGHSAPCTKEQWGDIAPVFLLAMEPLKKLYPSLFRRCCTPVVRLCVFAMNFGIDLTLENLFNSALVESFLATQVDGQVDARAALSRLMKEHGRDALSGPLGFKRRSGKEAYSASEVFALVSFAKAMNTSLRRRTLKAIVYLGAGSGIAREGFSEVRGSDVHVHPSGLFVATARGCHFVLPEFKEDVLALAKEVGEETFLPKGGKDRVARAAEWVANRKGVPELSGDRLRAFYVEKLLGETLPLLEGIMSLGRESVRGLIDREAKCVHLSASSSPSEAVEVAK